MSVSKIFVRMGRFLGQPSGALTSADTTTDDNFTETLGRKADAAAAGAVTTTDSLSGYIKQVVTLLLGAAPGKPLSIVKTIATVPTAGTDVTSVSAGGLIHLDELSVQKITGNETGNVVGLVVYTDDAVPLNQEILKPDGIPILKMADDLTVGKRWTVKLNHQLAVGKKVRIKAVGANAVVASYRISLKATVIGEGATLVAV